MWILFFSFLFAEDPSLSSFSAGNHSQISIVSQRSMYEVFKESTVESLEISDSNFDMILLSKLKLNDVKVKNTKFLGGYFVEVKANKFNFENSQFIGVRFSNSHFANGSFVGTNFKGSFISDTVFSNCTLPKNFRKDVILVNVKIENCKYE